MPEPLPHNTFAGAYVDRAGERRVDEAWQRDALTRPGTVFVPVWQGRCPADEARGRIWLLRYEDLPGEPRMDELVFLGVFRGAPAFALEVNEPVLPVTGGVEYRDLRTLGGLLPPDEASLAAHARAMVLWHQAQRHCGHCGAATAPDAGGYARICTGPGCGRRIFPRVDPAIIVLVAAGERCLLGRQPTWPEGRYSTIAGFVEPGESLEDAVRREVFEETNVRLAEVLYQSSQPWPFPSALMLGFRAVAESDEIVLNDGELEDARWFSRREIRAGWPKLPPRLSIARRLVDDWLGEDAAANDGRSRQGLG
ncbi:MAG TPA: NAD(+) diphosphatase [Woeseiaceae bacterium]|nr:NAD(+) diphosphatase [Woeseiaceae bacterium]